MIEVGMVLKHKDADWTAEFTRIVGNDLYAIMRSDAGGNWHSWHEIWNLEHAEAALKRREYVEVIL